MNNVASAFVRPDVVDRDTLKEKFLGYLEARTTNTCMLREAVKALIDRGVTRGTLIRWAVEAGYSKGYASSLLSQILCPLGLRANRVGGGRKPSPEALELLAHARERYGKKFLKVLRAACRAGKAELAKEEAERRICGTTNPESGKILAPQFSVTGTSSWRAVEMGNSAHDGAVENDEGKEHSDENTEMDGITDGCSCALSRA